MAVRDEDGYIVYTSGAAGPYDFDSLNNIDVIAPSNWQSVIDARMIVLNNAGTAAYDFFVGDGSGVAGYVEISAAQIRFSPVVGGFFDSTAFNNCTVRVSYRYLS